jgi:lipoprotein-releasing system ATP-binding protein
MQDTPVTPASPVKVDLEKPVVQLSHVHKSFNVGESTEVEVLHGIDMVLNAGEFVAVMGPSGSGKSTLLNLVGLLDRPTQGQLLITGMETTQLDDHALTQLRGRSIGFVFQYHHLIGAFSALENVMLPMVGLQGYPTAAIEARALSLIASVGLTPWRDTPATRLSGGPQATWTPKAPTRSSICFAKSIANTAQRFCL